MKLVFLTLSIIFLKVSYALSPANYFFTSTGLISFTSDAPLELIKATSTQMRGLIDVDKKTFSFRVMYRSFEGFNSGLQREHFNEKYMESEKYPEAFFNGVIEEPIDFTNDATYIINAKGKLNIHGIEKERIIKSTVVISKGEMHIESKFTVPVIDHNIKIPTVVTQKIATLIYVEIKADMKQKRLIQ